jgi:putative hydrolase
MVAMSQQPFGDIPLFREIQKILAAGEGPINFEIARQVAMAVATQGVTESPPPPETARALADAVRAGELVLSGYTRLPLAEPILSRTVGRTEWVASTLDAWRWILRRVAERFTGELTKIGPEEEANQLQAAIGQVSPLLLGLQAGTLVGHLARETLGRYDLPIPRDDDGHLFLVEPNVEQVASDYALDPAELRRWLALHDVARHLLVASVTWSSNYFRSLLIELVDAIEVDAAGLEQRLMDLQTRGKEMLDEGMRVEQTIPIVSTERHTKALERFRAFVAIFEGYAAKACEAVAPEVIGETAKIEEGMARHAASATEGRAILAGLLGIELDRALISSGETFCAAVVKLEGLPSLNRVWEAPDNLPTLDEVKDPFAWIERVLTDS